MRNKILSEKYYTSRNAMNNVGFYTFLLLLFATLFLMKYFKIDFSYLLIMWLIMIFIFGNRRDELQEHYKLCQMLQNLEEKKIKALASTNESLQVVGSKGIAEGDVGKTGPVATDQRRTPDLRPGG